MSKLLIDEKPLQVLPSLAVAIGLNEAIVLQQVHFWLRGAKEHDARNKFQNGRWWVYNTYDEWRADNFPFWSTHTIQRIVLNLEDRGLLISDQLEKAKYNRRKWYTIDYEAFKKLEDSLSTCQDGTMETGQDGSMDTTQDGALFTEITTESKEKTPGAKAAPDAPPAFAVGDRVYYTLTGETGEVRYFAGTNELSGPFYGVRMDVGGGLHDICAEWLRLVPADPPTPAVGTRCLLAQRPEVRGTVTGVLPNGRFVVVWDDQNAGEYHAAAWGDTILAAEDEPPDDDPPPDPVPSGPAGGDAQPGAEPPQRSGESETVAPPTKPKTPHQLMYDAITLAFQWTGDLNDNERGQVNKASKLLRQSKVTPDEVPALYRWCKAQKWPGFGPLAMANHVSEWRKKQRPALEAASLSDEDAAAVWLPEPRRVNASGEWIGATA